jgi:hypothetical protein
MSEFAASSDSPASSDSLAIISSMKLDNAPKRKKTVALMEYFAPVEMAQVSGYQSYLFLVAEDLPCRWYYPRRGKSSLDRLPTYVDTKLSDIIYTLVGTDG